MADFLKDMDGQLAKDSIKDTVEKEYDIDEHDLYSRRDASEYWDSSYKFYMQIRHRDPRSLSGKQKEWLAKIEEGLERDVGSFDRSEPEDWDMDWY
jgi:hypothetical protein